MTASCPMCGGKWDIEGQHYEVDLRCGDEHDIRCGYCKRSITFTLVRPALELSYQITFDSYEEEFKRLTEIIEELKRR